MQVGALLATYLSLLLGAPCKLSKIWKVVEEKVQKRLPLWKSQFLSKGGRLTLMKNTLRNLPIYFMSFSIIPKRVVVRLEKI